MPCIRIHMYFSEPSYSYKTDRIPLWPHPQTHIPQAIAAGVISGCTSKSRKLSLLRAGTSLWKISSYLPSLIPVSFVTFPGVWIMHQQRKILRVPRLTQYKLAVPSSQLKEPRHSPPWKLTFAHIKNFRNLAVQKPEDGSRNMPIKDLGTEARVR